VDLPFQAHRLPKRDAWGKDKVVQDFSLFHALFTFDIPKAQFRVVENGVEVQESTNAFSENGMMRMSTAGKDTVEVSSYRHPRYQPNRGILYSASWIMPDFEKDGTAEFGVFNGDENGGIESGLFFRANKGRLFAVRVTRTSSGVVESLMQFDLPEGADLTKGCLYDIQGQWRGIGSYLFMVTTVVGTTVLVMPLLGTLDAISVDNPALRIAQRVVPGTEEITIYCGCIDYTSEGGVNEKLQYASTYAIDKIVSSNAGLIAVRIPTRIGIRTYSRDAQLVRISIQADKKADYALYLSRNPASVTATGWTVINSGSYIESTSTISAVNLGLSRLITPFSVAANTIVERDNPFPEKISFHLTAGDILFLVCISGSGVSTTAILEFGEET